jgi:hypothetical protein
MYKNQQYFFILLLASFLIIQSCSDSDSSLGADEPAELTAKQETAVTYFKEVALGFEFGNASEITRKWNRDIKIFLGGERDEVLLDELDIVIEDLNELITDGDIELSITPDTSDANVYLYIGKSSGFVDIYPSAASDVESNFGLFYTWFSNSTNTFTRAYVFVDTERPDPLNQRHLLREELTQILGFGKDSPRFEDSIFQSRYSGVATDFNEYDRAVIQMLYHPSVSPGLNTFLVDPILCEIVADYI